jgi:predicted nucleic acid-binding protein
MIFDTDVLVWVGRGDAGAKRQVQSQLDRKISVVSLMELFQGARSREESRDIRGFLVEHDFEVVPIDEAISYRAAALIEEHALASGLQIPDALIAATALERGEVLATANARHFRAFTKLQLKVLRPAAN